MMKTKKQKNNRLLGIIPILLISMTLTFSCNQETNKEAVKTSAESYSASSAVKLTKQMPDAETSIFDWAKTQTPFKSGGFVSAATTMNTRFGKLEFPGGYPTKETIQKSV
jgi:hypothetical protein